MFTGPTPVARILREQCTPRDTPVSTQRSLLLKRNSASTIVPVMLDRHLPLKAKCPITGGVKPVAVPMTGGDSVLSRVQSGDMPRHALWELCGGQQGEPGSRCVVWVLENPSAIFGGVREHQHGVFCYCGIPPCRCTNESVRCPPPPKRVFTVYLNPREVVYLWRWERSDPEDDTLPLDWFAARRFSEGMLWPKRRPPIC